MEVLEHKINNKLTYLNHEQQVSTVSFVYGNYGTAYDLN